jgi:hypothetical protein
MVSKHSLLAVCQNDVFESSTAEVPLERIERVDCDDRVCVSARDSAPMLRVQAGAKDVVIEAESIITAQPKDDKTTMALF